MTLELIPHHIESYCIRHSSAPSTFCQMIEAFTKSKRPDHGMLTGPMEGSLIGFFAEFMGAKRSVEFGTYTGYSALCVAERMGADGKVFSLDINADNARLAQSFWDKSPHGYKIKSIVGPAVDTFSQLEGPFDLVFIDADKVNYLNYFKSALQKLAPRGLVMVDNCLWEGKILNSPETWDDSTRGIVQLNEHIKDDPRLSSLLLPIRDGVFLVFSK